MNDRIKICEAMGWKRSTATWSNARRWIIPGDDQPRRKEPPDPFTDANDDYAVLEWARSGHRNDGHKNITQEQFIAFDRALEDACWETCDYEIGDYARAALKVIE